MAYKKPTFCNQDGDPFSFLWMIKGDPPSYLFGTIHVPYTAVWEHVPENAKQAFSVCRRVYFELDLLHPDTLAALATCQMLPQGKNLSDVLPSDLYLRLKRHLEYVRHTMPRWMTADQRGRGMFADSLFDAIAGNWERKRPVWVMLMVNSLTESDVRARGVPVLDLYLAQEAERLRKKTAAVEKVEEQCLPLNGLDLSQVVFALNHTLLQHEQRLGGAGSAAYTTDDLIRHYNCGDLSAAVFGQDSAPLPALGNCSAADGEAEEEAALAKSTEAYFRRELIRNRNLRMGQRVGQLIRQNPGQSLFFAFGAGHFLGNNTVLDFVEAEGFEVEHLSVTEKIPKSKMKKSIPSFTEPDSKEAGRKTQSRRVNRHRSTGSFQRSGSSLNLRKVYETSPVPPPLTTQRPRRFNDLWVRLDANHKKKSSSETGPLEDRQLPQQAFRSWYQKSQEPASSLQQSTSNGNSLHHLHLHSKLMMVIFAAELLALGVFQRPQIASTGIS